MPSTKTIKGMPEKAYRKSYHESNKEKIAERSKAYYEANKDKIKAYYESNKEKIAEYRKAYYESNKEKIAERSKSYYEVNKDKLAERFRNTHINIPLLGGRRGKHVMYTNGVTKEIKEQLPKIVNDVLEECIKNPRKFLDDGDIIKSHNNRKNKQGEVSSHSYHN